MGAANHSTLPRHWAPFTTRTPWLLFVALAVIACIAAIEMALRTSLDSAQASSAARLVRKQVFVDDSESSTTEGNDIESISIADVIEVSETYADPTDFITLTTSSADEAPIEESTSSTGEPAIFTSANSEDFITLTSSNLGGQITQGTQVIQGGQSTITPAPTRPRITVSNTIPGAEPSTFEIIPTLVTVVEHGSTMVVSSSTTVPATSIAPTPASIKATQVRLSTDFGKLHYVLATYLGVTIAVVLKLNWSLIFSGLKLLEPFHRLSKPGGATAKESLMADYLSPSIGLSHLLHIFSGHWAMLFATTTAIAIGLLSPFSSEVMSIVATQLCQTPSGAVMSCGAVWVINTPTARGVQAVLVMTALSIFLVIIFNFHRKSGVPSNPSSIATMASLLSHGSIQHDLRLIDQTATDKEIRTILHDKRYTLRAFTDAHSQTRYGIVNIDAPIHSPSHPYEASSLLPHKSPYLVTSTSFSSSSPTTTPHSTQRPPRSIPSWTHTLRDILTLLLTLALFGTVLAYYLIGGLNPFNNFFNSKTFGPRFLLTTGASLLDYSWKSLEREVRILVPYRRLGAGDARPEDSVLVDVAGLPTSSLWGSLKRREWLHVCVAVTAMASDVLIIAVSGVPLADAQIVEAFRWSSWVAMGVSGWMVLVMGGVFWWRGQVRRLGMPREPETLVAVGLMLVDEGNGVVGEFGGEEVGLRGRERDERARMRGARYCAGWQFEKGGGERWCVGVDRGFSTAVTRPLPGY